MSVKNTQFRTRGTYEGENVSGKSSKGYHVSQLGDTGVEATYGIQATGGDISYYHMPGGVIWKSHTFNSTGTFAVTALATNPLLSLIHI